MKKFHSIIFLILSLLISACMDSSLKGSLVQSSAILLLLKKSPLPELSYSSGSFQFVRGVSVSAVPAVRKFVKECSILPSLPEGLSLDSTLCTVSGTPVNLQSEIKYSITVTGTGGKSLVNQIGISVIPVPIRLSYPGSPFTFYKTNPLTPVAPVLTGTAVSYSISPALPAGLVFDALTGQIAGTPSVYAPAADYTVTVKGEAETQTAAVSIKVDFLRDWPIIQPILTAQAGLGLSGSETAGTFGSLGGPSTRWLGGVLAPNGKIYGIPRSATSVLKIDPASNTASTFGSLGTTAVQKWYGGVLAPNGKIYGIPNSATSVLLIDPDTDTASTFGTVGAGANDWVAGVYAPNGKIYAIPASSGSVLVIDPVTNTTYTFGSLGGAASKWYGGVLAPNGKIYGIPSNSGTVLVIDPNTDTVTTFGSLGGATNKWRGGVLAPNGKIYAMPTSSTSILVIDPGSNTTYTFGSFGTTSPVNQKWIGGALAPNGKIYGIPCSYAGVLVIDPNTDTTSIIGGVGSSGGYDWTGGVLAPNGKIYGMPANSSVSLVIDSKSSGIWPADVYQSPYFDKF